MKNNVVKNLVSALAFLIFVIFLSQKFFDNYKLKIAALQISNVDSTDTNKLSDMEETTEPEMIINEVLDPYYTADNINIGNILKAKNTEIKAKLISLLNEFAVQDLKEIIGQERLQYIKLFDGMKIVGDSNVRHFDYYQVLEAEYYHPFAGKDIKYQTEHVKEYVDENTKVIIFWNGYNIAFYKDAEDYVNTYQKLYDKVKEVNPNTNVYICSLMPATEEAIKRDLEGELVHNIYKGKEYDLALKEHFGDNYIDIKFIGKRLYYGNDGIHFMPKFYYMLVPYLAYYLNLEY